MTTYTTDSIQGMLEEHKDFFNSGVTKEVSFRLQRLRNLKILLNNTKDVSSPHYNRI